mmetsp:Transcript_9919/g.29186  ORF Transcript_9919/g.29186 Transcript_9919/m.29186 type:complete len:248 (-) Transcript_9919:696-1439(-)
MTTSALQPERKTGRHLTAAEMLVWSMHARSSHSTGGRWWITLKASHQEERARHLSSALSDHEWLMKASTAPKSAGSDRSYSSACGVFSRISPKQSSSKDMPRKDRLAMDITSSGSEPAMKDATDAAARISWLRDMMKACARPRNPGRPMSTPQTPVHTRGPRSTRAGCVPVPLSMSSTIQRKAAPAPVIRKMKIWSRAQFVHMMSINVRMMPPRKVRKSVRTDHNTCPTLATRISHAYVSEGPHRAS